MRKAELAHHRGARILDFCRVATRFPVTWASHHAAPQARIAVMAKATTIKIKLVSSADTGFYYVTKKNSRTMTEKLSKKKYDPVAKKHVEFREAKIK